MKCPHCGVELERALERLSYGEFRAMHALSKARNTELAARFLGVTDKHFRLLLTSAVRKLGYDGRYDLIRIMGWWESELWITGMLVLGLLPVTGATPTVEG